MSYSHVASCHKFERDAVSWFGGPEDDFVNGLFLQDSPLIYFTPFEKFAQHRCVTRVWKVRVVIVFDEVEEGSEV